MRERKDGIHRAGRLTLGLGGDVGVGIQGEAGGVVTQHTADSLNVYSVLEGQGGEGVTEVVEAHHG